MLSQIMGKEGVPAEENGKVAGVLKETTVA